MKESRGVLGELEEEKGGEGRNIRSARGGWKEGYNSGKLGR